MNIYDKVKLATECDPIKCMDLYYDTFNIFTLKSLAMLYIEARFLIDISTHCEVNDNSKW